MSVMPTDSSVRGATKNPASSFPNLAGLSNKLRGRGRAGHRRLRDRSSVLLAAVSFASSPANPFWIRGTDVRRTDVRLRVRVIGTTPFG
jgi:hypothetical protein